MNRVINMPVNLKTHDVLLSLCRPVGSQFILQVHACIHTLCLVYLSS